MSDHTPDSSFSTFSVWSCRPGHSTSTSYGSVSPVDVVMVFPSKFALSFTMGSVTFMGSFAVAQGPSRYLRSLCARERLPFTLAYLASMAGTGDANEATRAEGEATSRSGAMASSDDPAGIDGYALLAQDGI